MPVFIGAFLFLSLFVPSAPALELLLFTVVSGLLDRLCPTDDALGGVLPTRGDTPGLVGVVFLALCCPGVMGLGGVRLTGLGGVVELTPGLFGEADTVLAPG